MWGGHGPPDGCRGYGPPDECWPKTVPINSHHCCPHIGISFLSLSLRPDDARLGHLLEPEMSTLTHPCPHTSSPLSPHTSFSIMFLFPPDDRPGHAPWPIPASIGDASHADWPPVHTHVDPGAVLLTGLPTGAVHSVLPHTVQWAVYSAVCSTSVLVMGLPAGGLSILMATSRWVLAGLPAGGFTWHPLS